MSSPKGALTPLAVSHADVLRHIHGHPNATPAQIASATGRIASNVKRDLPKLADAGFIALSPLVVMPEGEAVLAALDRAEGRVGSGAHSAPNAANQDSRVGSGGPSPTSTSETQSDVLILRHDQIRPNPLNLRKDVDAEALAGLADAIEAAGDVLQNLVVFPADAEGLHTLSAGERRWRAVGLLIEQGRWPASRPLRAIQRENTPGQTSFIALVENGQRQNLALIEEARGYQTLVDETGWSAREAAQRTGRDPRTVQEMLKVLREADPADIGRHEAGDPDMRWEALRNSVKRPAPPEPAPEPAPEPIQADIEDIAPRAAGPFALPPPVPIGGAGYSALPKPRADQPLRDLTPLESLAMVELAWKLQHFPEAHDAVGAPMVSAPKYWLDATASNLRQLGLVVFVHNLPGARIPYVGMPKAGRDWIEAKFPGGLEASDLEFAQDSVDIWAADGETYLTPWLNAPAEAEAAHESAAPDPAGVDVTHAAASEGSDPDNADWLDDDDLIDDLARDLRRRLEASRGRAERWNRRQPDELAAEAIAAVAEGRTLAAIEALAGLYRLEGAFADETLRQVALSRPIGNEAPEADAKADTPLFALRAGDLVSIGGAASGYRLLEATEKSSSAWPVQRPSFRAQQVSLKTGRNVGQPRTVSLHAIQGLVAAKALPGPAAPTPNAEAADEEAAA